MTDTSTVLQMGWNGDTPIFSSPVPTLSPEGVYSPGFLEGDHVLLGGSDHHILWNWRNGLWACFHLPTDATNNRGTWFKAVSGLLSNSRVFMLNNKMLVDQYNPA